MENEKMFELLEKFYGEFSQFRKETETKFDGLETKIDGIETRIDGLETKIDGLETRMDGLETKIDGLETRMDRMEIRFDGLEKTTARIELMIEHDIKPKIEVLFDGHLQNADKLERIEKEVTRQEEVILRKVR